MEKKKKKEQYMLQGKSCCLARNNLIERENLKTLGVRESSIRKPKKQKAYKNTPQLT